jgi:hypothetical protein
VKTRFEVYSIENHVEAHVDPSVVWRDMDDTLLFFPEIVCYKVFSLTVDDTCILEYNKDGTFCVAQGSSSLGNTFMCILVCVMGWILQDTSKWHIRVPLMCTFLKGRELSLCIVWLLPTLCYIFIGGNALESLCLVPLL